MSRYRPTYHPISLLVITAGLFTLIGGVVSFSGWVLDVPRFTDWNNSGISIQPNAAICVILSGAALLCLAARQTAVTLGCASIVLLIGSLTLLEWIIGYSLGIDAPLLFGRQWGRVGVVFPGRMGPPGSLSWTLIGAAMLLAAQTSKPRLQAIAAALALLPLSISSFSLIGYFYDVELLYMLPRLTVIAMQTAIFISVVSVGIIVSLPEQQPFRTLVNDGVVGMMSRRLLPLIVLAPIAIGYLRLAAEEGGFVELQMATAIRTLIEIFLLAGVFWWALRAVKRYEVKFLDSNQQLQQTLQTAAVGLTRCSRELRYISCNDAYAQLTGLPRERIEGRPVAEVMGQSAWEIVQPYVERVLEGHRVEFETELEWRASGLMWVQASYSPWIEEDGSVSGWVASVSDITERKRAEQAVQKSEAFASGILGSITDAFFTLDCDWRFRFANDAVLSRLGLTDEQIIGSHIWETFPQAVGTKSYVQLERAMRERIPVEYEVFYEPWRRWYFEKAYPTVDGGLSIYTQDITDRKRAEVLRSGQQVVLEMIATSRPLTDVLAAVCQIIQMDEPELICSVILPDEQGRHIGLSVGPSLPDIFFESFKGLSFAPPYIGPCAAVLDVGKDVVVQDVGADERFSPQWRELLTAHGLLACRSFPVLGANGSVLASFAIFCRKISDPTPLNAEVIDAATHLCATAIGRERAEQSLRRAEADARLLATVSAQLVREDDLQAIHESVIDAAVAIMCSQFASMQLIEEGDQGQWLRLLAYRGFNANAASFWQTVTIESKSTCGVCLKTRQRVIVSNITTSELMANSNDRDTYLDTGIHAVQTSPLISRGGTLLGMLSTHWDHPHEPTQAELSNLDILTRQAADLIERRTAERMLRASEERMRLAITAGDAATWDLDLITGTNLWSESHFRLLGYEPTIDRVAPGAVWREVIHPDDLPSVMTEWQRSEHEHDIFRSEYRLCHAHKSHILQVQAAGRFFYDEAGKAIRFVGVFYDITARKQAEAALREADRRKDEFLATLSHELRNPLAPIRNCLQILRSAGAEPDTRSRLLIMMDRQVNHMVRLVDDLLEVSRITRGKIELRKETIDLSSVVRNAVETAGPMIEAVGHQLAVNEPTEPLLVEADSVRLAQVIGNLLHNATKYTEKAGQIWLSVWREESQVLLSVKDTGTGIPAEMLPRVFDLFTQVDRTIGRAQGGLGIGLALVKNLVEMHGGSVEAKSDGPGKGSEFLIRLPLVVGNSENTQPNTNDAEDSTAILSGHRILVVDDNRDAADSLAMLLRFIGADIRTAYDGPSALESMRIHQPSIAFLDLGMPGMDGYAVAEQIRRDPECQEVALVALTGWGQEDDRRRTKAAGFDHHLTKPPQMADLQNILNSISTSREPHQRTAMSQK